MFEYKNLTSYLNFSSNPNYSRCFDTNVTQISYNYIKFRCFTFIFWHVENSLKTTRHCWMSFEKTWLSSSTHSWESNPPVRTMLCQCVTDKHLLTRWYKQITTLSYTTVIHTTIHRSKTEYIEFRTYVWFENVLIRHLHDDVARMACILFIISSYVWHLPAARTERPPRGKKTSKSRHSFKIDDWGERPRMMMMMMMIPREYRNEMIRIGIENG